MRKYGLNRRDGKLLGVCAGLADLTGIDATIIRIALVVGTIAGGWPWTLIAYGIAAWLGRDAAVRHRDDRLLGGRRASVADLNGRMSDIDRRLADIDNYVAAPNNRLAREIDELR